MPLYSNPKASGFWYDVFSDGSASHPYPEDSLGAAALRVFGTEEHEAKSHERANVLVGFVLEWRPRRTSAFRGKGNPGRQPLQQLIRKVTGDRH